jgi:hypothetical protein
MLVAACKPKVLFDICEANRTQAAICSMSTTEGIQRTSTKKQDQIHCAFGIEIPGVQDMI